MTLLSICLYPLARYFAHNDSGAPLFPVLCISYAFQFAIPIITKEPEIRLLYGVKYLDDASVVAVLLLSATGVLALQLGYYSLQGRRFARVFPTVDLNLNEKKVVIYCIVIGLLLPLTFGLRSIIDEQNAQQFSAVFTLVQNQQLVVIGILGWLVYSGRGAKWHRILLYVVVGISTVRGLSSAFLEQALIPVTILFVTKWLYSRRLSVPGIVFIVALVLFLSPVKSSFREAVGGDSAAAIDAYNSPFGSAALWVEQATQYWIDTLQGERNIVEATADATARTDLVHQFAHIYSLTPDVIPFQYGDTYAYFAVALIPRAIWPDKPVAGSANNFFGVAYGITTEEGAKRSTFGVSLLGEGYINFGTFGVVFIMFLQGVIIISLQNIFGREESGAGGQAVYLAFFIFFLNGVGTSAEILFGNILQNLVGSCALMWWAREKSSVRRLRRMKLRDSAPYKVSQ